MLATHRSIVALTAQDVMQRKVITIPHDLPLQGAARLLVQEQIGGAPVVDRVGRCIGVLSAADLVRWAAEGKPDGEAGSVPVCPFQIKGRLLTGEETVICSLPEGRCPLQEMRPTTGGRHTAICRQPHGVLCDWQQVGESLPAGTVDRYLTADVVTAEPTTTVPELARQMLDAHIHRIVVVDGERRPVGIVSTTDILAAVVYTTGECAV